MNQPHVKSKISISMTGEHNPAKKPESRDKLKKALTGMQFYNNGIINKRFNSSDKIPYGFVKGRIEPPNKKTVKNRV